MLSFIKRLVLLSLFGVSVAVMAADPSHWVTSWAASVQGPYPVGNPSASFFQALPPSLVL